MLVLGLSAYVAWASYWGIVGVASYVADLGAREVPDECNAASSIYLLALWAGPIVLAAPVVIGVLYGALGGGAYEFTKYRKFAKGPLAESSYRIDD
jgi:hypothetical protein